MDLLTPPLVEPDALLTTVVKVQKSSLATDGSPEMAWMQSRILNALRLAPPGKMDLLILPLVETDALPTTVVKVQKSSLATDGSPEMAWMQSRILNALRLAPPGRMDLFIFP